MIANKTVNNLKINYMMKIIKIYKKTVSFFFIFVFLLYAIYAQDTGGEKLQIVDVEYDITGLTKEKILKNVIPIDKNIIFASKEEFDNYIDFLNTEFNNIRSLEFHSIDAEFFPENNGIVPVKLIIHTKDTWSLIVLPYPKFDSNTGMQLKLKLKDYNFAGFLLPFDVDIIYEKDVYNKSAFYTGTNFGIPFKKDPINFLWDIHAGIQFKQSRRTKFEFATGLDIAYKYKILTFHTGVRQGINIYPDTDIKKTAYHFTNSLYFYVPIEIYKTKNAGTLIWTPQFELSGNWRFKKITDENLKGLNIKWSHSLKIEKINWVNNFRHGYSLSCNNNYLYNTFKKNKVNISFAIQAKGFYSFIDRIGLYGKFYFFYNLNKVTSVQAGQNLRGILDRRIYTDTAFTFNFDLPIKIGLFKFEEITGIEWTRFLSFELHVVPFLDMAFTHDKKTSAYFNPKYGWYSGGLEFIIYPVKMRSVYGRVSMGWDLTELKNIKTLSKRKGIALRDGDSVFELFIGIGLHY